MTNQNENAREVPAMNEKEINEMHAMLEQWEEDRRDAGAWTEAELAEFIDSYAETLLWSDADDDVSALWPDGLDAFTDAAREAVEEDCLDFMHSHGGLLRAAGVHHTSAGHDFALTRNRHGAGLVATHAGLEIVLHQWRPWQRHFALTRNRHGAGFWDRGLGKLGDQLTEAAHAYGETYLTLTGDGTVEVC